MHISHTCTATNGLSGSPILLAGVNLVVGIHAKRHGATGYGIGVNTVRSFLSEYLHVVNLLFKHAYTRIYYIILF
jgi:radical SAM superfamily enzyme with C-terminal helix-hairpin-helix motif